MKHYISVKSYANLCDLSERTIRRYMATASIEFVTESPNRTLIAFNELNKSCTIPLTTEECNLILQADMGNSEAQADLAVLFLTHKKNSQAVYWLNLATKQQHADAMQLLANCFITGLGVKKDNNLALMWLSKAASLGSLLAKKQIEGIFPH